MQRLGWLRLNSTEEQGPRTTQPAACRELWQSEQQPAPGNADHQRQQFKSKFEKEVKRDAHVPSQPAEQQIPGHTQL